MLSVLGSDNEVEGTEWKYLKARIAMDIAQGMNFLHNRTLAIVHNDLKSPNILLSSRNYLDRVVAKVADFGLSSMMSLTSDDTEMDSSNETGSEKSSDESSNASKRMVHNPIWLAPEVMKGDKNLTEKLDVYSYGVILWELNHKGQRPFDSYKISFSSILESKIIKEDLRPQIDTSTCTEHWKQLMIECWDGDPKKRPDFESIVSRMMNFVPGETNQVVTKEILDPPRQPRGRAGGKNPGQGAAPPRPLIRMSVRIDKPNFNFMNTSSKNLGQKLEDEVFNLGNIREKVDLRPQMSSHITAMINVDDKEIWCGCGDGSIAVWSVHTKNLLTRVLYHAGEIISFLYLSKTLILDQNNNPITTSNHWEQFLDGETTNGVIWSLTSNRNIVIWDVASVKPLKIIKLSGEVKTFIAIHNTVWLFLQNELIMYDYKGKKLNYNNNTPLFLSLIQSGYSLLRCKTKLWIGGENNKITIIDINTLNEEMTLKDTCGTNRSNGEEIITVLRRVKNTIWSCGWNDTVTIWDPVTREVIKRIGNVGEKILDVAWIGSLVWMCTLDQKLVVYDTVKGEMKKEVKNSHRDAICRIVPCCSAAGLEIWSGSWDESIHVFVSPWMDGAGPVGSHGEDWGLEDWNDDSIAQQEKLSNVAFLIDEKSIQQFKRLGLSKDKPKETFELCMKDNGLKVLFRKYLISVCESENLDFVQVVEVYNRMKDSGRGQMGKTIVGSFFKDEERVELKSVDVDEREHLRGLKEFEVGAFDKARDQVLEYLEKKVLGRFLDACKSRMNN
eukprot:TRINITY_DN4538_c0_g1_i3.p1 TRINITY_DN4538_c0_g1~~TRINITY_DN4538_c0_g1_i3.p1  ORF type:complete len:783 (+),score=199.41 TRINITY_DN4538_c0_g1_i3:133-2481(+)